MFLSVSTILISLSNLYMSPAVKFGSNLLASVGKMTTNKFYKIRFQSQNPFILTGLFTLISHPLSAFYLWGRLFLPRKRQEL